MIALLGDLAFAQSAAQSATIRTIVPGVTHERKDLRSPDGLPWSVHVLRVDRKAKAIQIRAAEPPGEMHRELPTEIAKQDVRPGEELIAVVNGDYDLAAPYLGISDGLDVTSGHLWTTGKATWPAFALRKNGEPVMAVPEILIELGEKKQKYPIYALNKPINSVHGSWPRAYTRDFRELVTSEKPFQAIVVGNLAPLLPLRLNRKFHGEVLEVLNNVRQAAVPMNSIVIAGPPPDSTSSSKSNVPSLGEATFAAGQKVTLRFEAKMAGRRDLEHVIGGFPILVRGGKRGVVGQPGANLKLRHPRTAVCYNAREIIFVVVDGRQPQLSVGMTLEELGDLMVSLGCIEAMNTDGGGSSVMAVTAPPAVGATSATSAQPATLQIVNSPSDGRERGRGNAWVIVRKKK